MIGRNTEELGRLAELMALVLAVLLVGACGSAARATASASASTATEAACQQVSAVLSDGPDPGADPVGYAEAQIIPLRQISTSGQALRAAIRQLADAYQEFFASNGASQAKQAVAVAAGKVDAICPGAAS
jgi:hypothetical protein